MRSSVLAWSEESLTEAQRRVKAAPHFARNLMALTALLFPGVHSPWQLIRSAFRLLVLYGFGDPLDVGNADILRGFGKWMIGRSCRTKGFTSDTDIGVLPSARWRQTQGAPQLGCTALGGPGDGWEDSRSRSIFVHQFDCGGGSASKHLFELDQPTIWQQCQ